MSAADEPVRLTLAHSPDPDDAFMWWPLFGLDGGGAVIDTDRFQFGQVTEDIESLNQRAQTKGDLDITALSCAQYARVADRYMLTACGASVGDAYGPKLVSAAPMTIAQLRGKTIATPGAGTTAFAVLSLMLGVDAFTPRHVDFAAVADEVTSGRVDAGVVIHEGQLTYEADGLHLIADLGQWWQAETGLLLPLGVNAVRRDLDDRFGPGTLDAVSQLLRESIEHASAHREQSIAYALNFARGVTPQQADTFVEMYVNQWTLDFGARGIAAVEGLLHRTAAAGLTPEIAIAVV